MVQCRAASRSDWRSLAHAALVLKAPVCVPTLSRPLLRLRALAPTEPAPHGHGCRSHARHLAARWPCLPASSSPCPPPRAPSPRRAQARAADPRAPPQAPARARPALHLLDARHPRARSTQGGSVVRSGLLFGVPSGGWSFHPMGVRSDAPIRERWKAPARGPRAIQAPRRWWGECEGGSRGGVKGKPYTPCSHASWTRPDNYDYVNLSPPSHSWDRGLDSRGSCVQDGTAGRRERLTA